MSTDPGTPNQPYSDPTAAGDLGATMADATTPANSPWGVTPPPAPASPPPPPPAATPSWQQPGAQPGYPAGAPEAPAPQSGDGLPQYGLPQYGQPSGQPPYTQAPYGQPQYGQQDYGQASYPPYAAPGQPMPAYGYGYAINGREHPQATVILILGILSIVLCQLTGPFAWVMGRKALREIDSGGEVYSNRTQVQAGMICGIIGTVLMILGIIWLVFMVVIAIASTPR